MLNHNHWTTVATGFYLFIKGACLPHISFSVKYFIEHQNKRPCDVNKVWGEAISECLVVDKGTPQELR